MALSVLALPGCSAGEPDPTIDIVFNPCALVVDVDPSATTEQHAGIESALAIWNRAGGLGLTQAGSEATPSVPLRFDAAPAAQRGLYDDERGIIFINRGIEDPRALTLTVAHELGHAFGLWHVAASERTSVMNPGTPPTEPTAQDVESVRAIWGTCQAESP